MAINSLNICAFLLALSINPSEGGQSLFVSNLDNSSISVVHNSTTAALWRPNSPTAALFYGHNASAIFYNSENSTGIYIPNHASNNTWNSTTRSWPEYSKHIPWHHLEAQGRLNGTFFTSSNITHEISNAISSALSNFSSEAAAHIRSSGSLSVLENITSSLSNPITLLPYFGNAVVPAPPNSYQTLQFLRGMYSFVNSLRSGSGVFPINPGLVFQARNGLQALVNLLENAQLFFSLDQLLSETINAELSFLRLVSLLGGSSCEGVNGRLRVLYEGNGSCNGSLVVNETEWRETVQALYNITGNLGLQFAGLANLTESLNQEGV